MDFTDQSDYHNPELTKIANKQFLLGFIAGIAIVTILAFYLL